MPLLPLSVSILVTATALRRLTGASFQCNKDAPRYA